jgi:hypothetical protein
MEQKKSVEVKEVSSSEINGDVMKHTFEILSKDGITSLSLCSWKVRNEKL